MKVSKIFVLLIIWQVGIIAVVGLSPMLWQLRTTYLGGATQAYESAPLMNFRSNFDGNHYTDIAKKGYGYAQQAFFPGYPKLIKILNPVFGSHILAGVAISTLGFVGGIIMLRKLVLKDFSESVVKWTIISLLVFPVSFYFSAVYTEGLFFFLSVCAFYAARSRRWWIAGIVGGFAAYTRIAGVLLFPALLIEYILSAKDKKLSLRQHVIQILPLLCIPMGLLVYMNFLQQSMGDPLAFLHVQKLFNQGRSDKLIMLYQVFWRYIKMAITVNRSDPLYLTIMCEFATAIGFLATSIISILRQRSSYAFYAVASFLLPTLTGSFTSLPRYVTVIFPAFIIIGAWLSQSKLWVKVVYLTINIVLFVLFLSMFARGYWVA